MNKGCMAGMTTFLVLLVFFCLSLEYCSPKPADKETIWDVKMEELNNEAAIDVYKKTLDFLNENKARILKDMAKDTVDCPAVILTLPDENDRKLPADLSDIASDILTKGSNSGFVSLIVCGKNDLALKIFKKDHERYLYVNCLLYIATDKQSKVDLEWYVGRLIDKKYWFFVKVDDAFNYIIDN